MVVVDCQEGRSHSRLGNPTRFVAGDVTERLSGQSEYVADADHVSTAFVMFQTWGAYTVSS